MGQDKDQIKDVDPKAQGWSELEAAIRKICPAIGDDQIADYLLIVRAPDGVMVATGSPAPGEWKQFMDDFAKDLK